MSRLTEVSNTARRFGEADRYLHFRVGGRDALATPAELDLLFRRAERQPEDLPRLPSLWRRILDAVFAP